MAMPDTKNILMKKSDVHEPGCISESSELLFYEKVWGHVNNKVA